MTPPAGFTEMKDSGFRKFRGKYLFSVKQGYPCDSDGFSPDSGIPVVRIRDITSGCTETKYTKSYDKKDTINTGSLLIGMDGDFNIRWWENGEALLNQRCCEIIPFDCNKRFLYYLFPLYLYPINATMYYTTVKHLAASDLYNQQFYLPPIYVQNAIATYLDTHCSKIDSMIATARANIEDYKALKQSIITQAVTKGLDPEVEMKDSGIEWIGEIPKHWNIAAIKRSFNIFSGATPVSTEEKFWNGNILWVTPADFKTSDHYVSFGKHNITKAGYKSCGTNIVPLGSILFSKRAPVGTVCVTNALMCTNQGCLSCVPKHNNNSNYFYYVMSICTEEFEKMSAGTTFKEISATSFSNFILPLPPVKQQDFIATYLDTHCSKIDALISEQEALIADLEAAKKSLIYECVTGKRRVPILEEGE